MDTTTRASELLDGNERHGGSDDPGVAGGSTAVARRGKQKSLNTYAEFLARKRLAIPSVGIEVKRESLNRHFLPWQRDVTWWALRRGRAGLFPTTGLGKTIMQLVIADELYKHSAINTLILTPLAVARQTLGESRKFNIESPIKVCCSQADVEPGITITNYEKLHKFDASYFGCIELDEGSILKSIDGKTRDLLIETFQRTPYRFVLTATPSPNDMMEIGSYAEFLGIMTRAEMLAMFFTHDGGDTSKWRLRGHAEKKFFEWMAGWAVMLNKPSDIGHDDTGYNLPPLRIHEHVVDTTRQPAGFLFPMEARTLGEQREARRDSIDDRVELLASLANVDPGEPWITWCNLNEESVKATKAVHGAIEITGSMKDTEKERRLIDFTDGLARAVVTKPDIAGFGLNWQHCCKMALLGLGHSWEQYKQMIARIHRFGQKRPCDIHVITSDRDGGVMANIKRKEKEAERLMQGMIDSMGDLTRQEIGAAKRDATEYKPTMKMELPKWL